MRRSTANQWRQSSSSRYRERVACGFSSLQLLRFIRKITAERGIALIFDEIQCGLGRLGTFMAYERFGVTPDMVTLAKPLAGGLPMGAILVTQEIADTIKPGDHGTTFGGGPLVAAVANHVVRRLADPSLLEAVRENGEWIGEQTLRDARERVREFAPCAAWATCGESMSSSLLPK